ncbi:MAG TPA: ABC transporter permease [Terracidiphilus sp.]|nr:ABC transporter permease [Terracidiphilus sp.]
MLGQDIRYALRQLRRSPGFALTVVITLALGIGANAAVFTLFDQVLLRMLPVEKPKELVRFLWTGSFSGAMSSFGGNDEHHIDYFSVPMYKDLRDKNQVFSGMLAADRTGLGITWHNQAEGGDAEIVSGNYFQVLGLKPALGRLFTDADDTAKNANPVVVLSYDYWRTRFAADRSVVGQSVLVNGHPFTIVGVAPQNFHTAIGGYRPIAFVPISMVDIAMPWMAPRENLTNHKSVWLTLVARRKPGVSIAQAEASLAPLWHSLRAEELKLYKAPSERFRTGYVDKSHLEVKDDSQGFSPGRMDLKTPLFILMSMAGLLVAMCAINVATLLLLRAAGRAREMSMRYALGARRRRIVSQLLVEGGLLGLFGAFAGVFLAPLVATILVRIMTGAEPGSEPYSTSIDARVLLFTLAISVVASVLFSVAPVFHFLRPDLANSLRQNAGTLSKDSQRFRKLAVGAQIALSVMLLGGAGLFVRTLDNLRKQPVGFATAQLEKFDIAPDLSGYGEDRIPQLVNSVVDGVRRIPGVQHAAASSDPELSGDSTVSGFRIEGYQPKEDENMSLEDAWVTPDYFATLQHPILAGREFTAGDGKGAPKVVVVNLKLAQKYFGSPQNALGRMMGDGDKPDTLIVGVVGNSRHTDLRTELGPAAYRPYAQMPHPSDVEVYARSTQPPDAIQPQIRKVVHDLDPTLVMDGLRTMEEQVTHSASDERALAILAIGFSALAMLLAAVGLYGVLAYSTEQRTREIGVRLALGAPRGGVMILIVREMAWIAGAAIVVALPSVVGLAQLFRTQLYGVTAADPLALAGAVVLTLVMIALAAALPARRAAEVEPMQALRME